MSIVARLSLVYPIWQEPNVTVDMDTIEKDLTKADHCYIGGRLKRPGIFQVDTEVPPPTCLREGCSNSPPLPVPAAEGGGYTWRVETYFYRANHTYIEAACCKPRLGRQPGPHFSRFLFYGDSTVRNSWGLLLIPARKPCRPKFWRPRMIEVCQSSGTHAFLLGCVNKCQPVHAHWISGPVFDE